MRAQTPMGTDMSCLLATQQIQDQHCFQTNTHKESPKLMRMNKKSNRRYIEPTKRAKHPLLCPRQHATHTWPSHKQRACSANDSNKNISNIDCATSEDVHIELRTRFVAKLKRPQQGACSHRMLANARLVQEDSVC